jgi:hypothetical protein
MRTRTRQLAKKDWSSYFNGLSAALKATRIDLFCESLALGVQPAMEHLALLGITYDHADDAIDISTEGMEHRIQHPARVFVQEAADGELVSCLIGDGDGQNHILELRPSLQLGASS